tara:strand:- start:379 stop:1734 length:1356 start_codon:yes stop_codon:yes gene_type:complete
MINWVEENASDDPNRLWELLVEVLSNSSEQGAADSVSMSLQRMLNWLKEHDPENQDMIWDVLDRKVKIYSDGGNNTGISMMLREMSRFLQEYNTMGQNKSRFDNIVRDYLNRLENVGDILELSVSLSVAGDSLPSEIFDKFDENDMLHNFVERWCRTYEDGFTEGWELLSEQSDGESKTHVFKSKEMSNLFSIKIAGSIPEIEPSEIQDRAVLDLPNILGWRRKDPNGTSVDDPDILEEILNEAESEFGRTWVYLTPTTITKHERIVRRLIDRGGVGILLGSIISNEINEDWCFISFAMIEGCHIVSRDKFAQEIELKPQIEDYLERARTGFVWSGKENSFVIQRPTLRYVSTENSELSEDEASLTNLCMKIVYDHYGPEVYARGVRRVSLDAERAVLRISTRRGYSLGRIIGRRGSLLDELREKLLEKIGAKIEIELVPTTDLKETGGML